MTTTAAAEPATAPLPSFRDLRELACASEGIREFIGHRSSAMARTGWRIDSPAGRDLERMFLRPSPGYMSFAGWLGQIAGDLIVCDASAICLRAAGGGLSLDLIDPATVEPVLDRYGRLRGFMQYAGEVPRRDFGEIAPAPPAGAEPLLGLLPARFVYLSFGRRRWTPFGYSPLEQAISRRPDGTVDLTATEERLWQTADDAWAARCMGLLAGALFGRVLDRIAPGSRWRWEAE